MKAATTITQRGLEFCLSQLRKDPAMISCGATALDRNGRCANANGLLPDSDSRYRSRCIVLAGGERSRWKAPKFFLCLDVF